MADVIVKGDTSGAVTLSAPAVAGTVTVTLPATSGTMLTTASSTGVSGSAISSGTVAEAYGGTGTSTGYYGFKNRIINGAMGIWQRSTAPTAGAITSFTYNSVDRFQFYSGTTSFTITQNTSVPSGFQYSLKFQRTPSSTGLTQSYITQTVETSNCYDLAGQSVTLSFWAKAGANFSASSNLIVVQINTGTVADQGGNPGSWTGLANPINTTQSITTTWTRYSFTGTFASNILEAALLISWTPTGTAGADDAVYITGVQLEKGSTATSFDYRPYGTEFMLCQRYYTQEINTGLGGESCFSGNVTSGSPYYANTTFKVTMRVAPVVTLTNHTNLQFSSTVGTAYPQVSGFVETRNANATGAGYFFSTYVATSEL